MLTDKRVKELRPGNRRVPDREPGDDRDRTVSGFGVRVLPSGVKTFYLDYRVNGVGRRPVIASWPNWTVSQARAEARRWRVLIDQGVDPFAQREAVRSAPTVATLVDRYVEERLPRLREGTRRNDLGMIKKWILPEIGRMKVAAIRATDVERLHSKITRSGASTHANRVIALLSTMLTHAVRWECVEKNVARGAIRRNYETRRRRYLSPAEIARLSEALAATASQDAANAIRLLLMTGARRNEICGARWSEFDLAAGVWTKEASETKQKRTHTTPLSAPALQLLSELRSKAATGEEFVFPGRFGEGFLNVRTTWQNVRKAAGLDDVRLHDLRHSFASILVSSGASLPLIGALLGHSNPATTARYSHLFMDPQRAAVERVGAGASGEVVPLKRAR
jgi:integrase